MLYIIYEITLKTLKNDIHLILFIIIFLKFCLSWNIFSTWEILYFIVRTPRIVETLLYILIYYSDKLKIFHIWKKVLKKLRYISSINHTCILFIFFIFYFYFILFYNTVLLLPYIDMNPPRVYMSSQSWTPPPTSHPISSLWIIPVHQPQASRILYRT